MEGWVLSQGRKKIITAGDYYTKYGPNGDRIPFTPIEVALAARASQIARGFMVEIELYPEQIDTSVKALAEIHQGQWFVLCPWDGIAHAGRGLELGDPRYPLFICCSCWNQLVGGKAIEVEYPADWAAIEEAIIKRPDGQSRGWLQGESLQDILNENIANGID